MSNTTQWVWHKQWPDYEAWLQNEIMCCLRNVIHQTIVGTRRLVGLGCECVSDLTSAVRAAWTTGTRSDAAGGCNTAGRTNAVTNEALSTCTTASGNTWIQHDKLIATVYFSSYNVHVLTINHLLYLRLVHFAVKQSSQQPTIVYHYCSGSSVSTGS